MQPKNYQQNCRVISGQQEVHILHILKTTIKANTSGVPQEPPAPKAFHQIAIINLIEEWENNS